TREDTPTHRLQQLRGHLPLAPSNSMSHFFFNDTATTEIYTLSLHDALPICEPVAEVRGAVPGGHRSDWPCARSEEHTSELQSHLNLVCRLLLEKKTKIV